MIRCMLHPDHKLRHLWDFIIIMLTVAAAIEIPFRVVFNYPLEGYLRVLAYSYFIFFSIDIFLNFRTAVSVEGRLITDPKYIAKRYLSKWFIFDLLSAIPFELLSEQFGGGMEAAGMARMARFLHPGIFRILSLAKLVRMMHLFKFMSNWQRHEVLNPSILRLLFSLFWLAIIAHWISLGWLALETGNPEKSEIDNYIWALYWCITTLTTIGYGDISPSFDSRPQMIYTMFVQISGAGMYGYMIGNLASILANIDTARAQFRERMEKVSTFMRNHDVPADLQSRVRNYYNYLWDSRRGSDESDVLNDLPQNLKVDVALFLNRDIIQKVPIFKEANEHLIRQIVMALKPIIYLPGDYIFRQGDMGEEMYFISRGAVEVVSADEKVVYATLSEGSFFGEIALLLSSERTAGIRAKDYCDLYYLDKSTFENIIQHYPDFEAGIRKMAEQRRNELNEN